MCFLSQCFLTLESLFNKEFLYLGDNSSCQIMGFGTIEIMLPKGEIKQIDKVLYVPQLKKNLISVSQATDAGYTFIFSPQSCVLMDKKPSNKVLVVCQREGQLYKIGSSHSVNIPLHKG